MWGYTGSLIPYRGKSKLRPLKTTNQSFSLFSTVETFTSEKRKVESESDRLEHRLNSTKSTPTLESVDEFDSSDAYVATGEKMTSASYEDGYIHQTDVISSPNQFIQLSNEHNYFGTGGREKFHENARMIHYLLKSRILKSTTGIKTVRYCEFND